MTDTGEAACSAACGSLLAASSPPAVKHVKSIRTRSPGRIDSSATVREAAIAQKTPATQSTKIETLPDKTKLLRLAPICLFLHSLP
jgi:hypothetical protein